jgi:predicted nuclease of predicted toxin-antitoxin system
MDVHVKTAITRGLRRRNVVVMRAQDDGMGRKADPLLLDRALGFGYVVFTQDVDFLVEVARRHRAGEMFAGVVYARQRVVSVRRCIDDLELIAKVYDPADMMNRLVYLPL